MFITALFTMAKKWKQPKCPSVDEWIKKRWYIYTMEYYSAIRRKQILPFATTWMELEGVMLSEISQAEKVPNDFTYLWSIRTKKKPEGTKQQQTHRTQEWTNSYQRERDGGGWVEGRDKSRERERGHYDWHV